MELLNYIPPNEKLPALRKAYDRLKSIIPKGNAQLEIEEDLRRLSRIPNTLAGTSSRFEAIYKKLKFKFIKYDDPKSD